MKRFPVLLSILFLLTGCASYTQAGSQAVLSETDVQTWSLYDADSTMEAVSGGAVFAYPLKDFPCTRILPIGDHLVLFSASEDTTLLAKMSPETGIADSFLELSFPLSAQDPSVHPLDAGFSCYDAVSRQTLVIDENLQIIRQIPAPQELVGSPILSADGNTLYYCTETAIRSLDLSSGISRVLKEASYSNQQVSGLLLSDTVLQCRLSNGNEDSSLFLSTNTGTSLGSCEKLKNATSSEDWFLGFLEEGHLNCLIFGTPGAPLQTLLLPHHNIEQYILPKSQALLVVESQSAEEIVLHHYDLHSGHRTACLSLTSHAYVWGFVSREDGSVWFMGYDPEMGCDTLYCWNPAKSPVDDGQIYTQSYFSRQQPDEAQIAQCMDYAMELYQKFGIEIRIYKDADDFLPNGYTLGYEHLAPVLLWELQQLEQNLTSFPPEVLQTLVQRFDGLNICILRSISPVAANEDINGITFWNGHHPYIALAAGTDTQGALYHELCHLMDTVVLNESSAYDTWNQLNPTGFEYDYDYAANRSRNSTAFLLDSSRYFVDMYSMSFPKEDRARIMEYAMKPSNAQLFQTEPMQRKLNTLCTGIREAFRLEESQEIFLWEQYLHNPLVPTA